MKALILTAPSRFEYTEAPVPQVAADEVLVAVRACGICGSDVHGADGSTGRRRPPIVMGHEAAGVIAEVGADVTDRRRGDRVTFDSTVYCGRCWHCRRGEINLCDDRRVLGVSCAEYRRDGAFAEYVAVPQHVLYRLPDALAFEHAAMVEPLSVAVHAVARTPLQAGDTAVVVGAGVIGLLIIQALRAAGAGVILAVDLDASRLELARQCGADVALRADVDDVAAEARTRTDGRGADAAFEVVGVTGTVQTALACLRKGAALTLVGNLSPTVELPLQAAVTREITLAGSCASRGEYPQCLAMMAERRVDVAPLISATAPLADGAAWFARLAAKAPGLVKVILQPEQQP